jgi:MFS family permease
VFTVVIFAFLLFQNINQSILPYFNQEITGLFYTSTINNNLVLVLTSLITMVFLLVWGYVFDRYERRSFLSLGSVILSLTAFMMCYAPTYGTFVISQLTWGVAQAIPSGIFSLTGDLFIPRNRGKIIGFLYLTQPIALILSIFLFPILLEILGWRFILFAIGTIGLIFAIIIYLTVGVLKRGEKEPALAHINVMGTYLFDFNLAKRLLRHPSLLMIYGFSFFATIPWAVQTSWFMENIKNVNPFILTDIYRALALTLIALSLGSPLSGLMGDMLFQHRKNGRIIISAIGTIAAGLFLYSALQIQGMNIQTFLVLMMLMGFFMSFLWPNMIASVMDITLPELRSSAIAIVLFFQALGYITGPIFTNLLLNYTDEANAILLVCVGAWVASIPCLLRLLFSMPKDVERLRRHMAYRSHLEARLTRTKINNIKS